MSEKDNVVRLEDDAEPWLAETLANLPDPQLPADVRNRWNQALVETPLPQEPTRNGGRRNWLPALAAVAAVVLAVAVVSLGSPADQTPSSTVAADADAAEQSADQQTNAADLDSPNLVAAGLPLVASSGREYRQSTLADQLQQTMRELTGSARSSDSGNDVETADLGRESAAANPPPEATECLAKVAMTPHVPILVDLSSYAGRPAMLVLGQQDIPPEYKAIVLATPCDPGAPRILYRVQFRQPRD